MKSIIRITAVLLLTLLFAGSAYADGWVVDSAGKRYLKHNGSFYTDEWFKDGSTKKWYYFGSDGYMLHDQWVGGLYYVDSNGEMLQDAITPDLYYVGKNGKYYDRKNEKGQKDYFDVFTTDDAVITVRILYPDRTTGSKSGISHVFEDDFGYQYDRGNVWCRLRYIPGSSNGQYKSRSQSYTVSRTVNGVTTTTTEKMSLHVPRSYDPEEFVYLFKTDLSGQKSADGKVHVDYVVSIP